LCKNKDIEIFPAKVYENAFSLRKDIIKENKGLSGIYLLTNKLTDEIYVGQSVDLSKRFIRYFSLSYLKSKESLIISRALIKYGYVNFSVSILEYCDKSILTEREQYYLDKLEPKYNILKIAGSSLGYIHSQVSKQKRSKALKGVYVGIKSPLFGKNHTIETKNKMSIERKGENNYFYGKTHSDHSKEIMRQKALDRKHSIETKYKMSKAHRNPVYVYEKTDLEGFKLIGSFVSARRAAKFLDMSGTTVIKYMKSGEVFKNRYKFSSN
jgi:group I intron endonuclease